MNAPLVDEDEDDICPVCESECTCHNRGSQSSASRSLAPTRTSTFTSTSYSPLKPSQPQLAVTAQPLKIKLTVPPNLKFRKNPAAGSSSAAARSHTSHLYAQNSSTRTDLGSTSAIIPHHAALGPLDSSAPKRRGRPPKAVVAAREAAKAALASAHASYGGNPSRATSRKGTHVTVSSVKRTQNLAGNKRGGLTKPGKKASGTRPIPSSLSTYSSDEDAHYPTFMSAASSSSLTSSSESQNLESGESSESSSDSEDDSRFLQKGPSKKDVPGFDTAQKRRDHGSGSRWEIKPRKQSVDPEALDAESEDTSSDDDNADDEDDSDDDDDDDDEAEAEAEDEENAAEADVEETGLAEIDDEPEVGDEDGKLGVSFGGDDWSEDEESSFDADIFFANLDDSSDECASPAALRFDAFGSDMDAGSAGSFSGDEADALLLMDIDPSVQVRRSTGEFEVGVELDGLALGLDGQLLLPSNFAHFAAFEGGSDGSNDTDVEMAISRDDSSSADEASDSGESGLLGESDGETTEDELVDSNGLPNSKAMMLFRWPEPISAVDPQSTVTQSPGSDDTYESPQPSHTLRTALRSMSSGIDSTVVGSTAQRHGEDFDDDEQQSAQRYVNESGHAAGVPVMGQFITAPAIDAPKIAVIDGSHNPIPSPFPRSRIIRAKRRKSRVGESVSGADFTTDSEFNRRSPSTPFLSANPPSSDELGSQSHALTSDDPSSTDAIDLDDVLDASFLDSEPLFEPTTPSQHTWLMPSTPSAAPTETLNRWDRIPVGTFRRTRETSLLENTPGSDSGIANLYPAISALLNSDLLGTPKSKGKGKASSTLRPGAASTLVISPVLLPVRDGDRTPTGDGVYNPFQQNGQSHQQKSRRELRKEKAMMKRKMVGKQAPQPSMRNHPHARHHYPNMKNRGSSSMQRNQFASSSHVPHLNL
ncbi:hypothetical protein PsYK624_072710 [Phanerochaete sordida]|uniref:Uncharacterized protein n=1 Tax=Phanerochaete sordida TaxID=48140 RepID=A0A9P3LEL8_9APHY|nr:hypothetical protein PsYK624_072710 [Phanerochaete sordida]